MAVVILLVLTAIGLFYVHLTRRRGKGQAPASPSKATAADTGPTGRSAGQPQKDEPGPTVNQAFSSPLPLAATGPTGISAEQTTQDSPGPFTNQAFSSPLPTAATAPTGISAERSTQDSPEPLTNQAVSSPLIPTATTEPVQPTQDSPGSLMSQAVSSSSIPSAATGPLWAVLNVPEHRGPARPRQKRPRLGHDGKNDRTEDSSGSGSSNASSASNPNAASDGNSDSVLKESSADGEVPMVFSSVAGEDYTAF